MSYINQLNHCRNSELCFACFTFSFICSLQLLPSAPSSSSTEYFPFLLSQQESSAAGIDPSSSVYIGLTHLWYTRQNEALVTLQYVMQYCSLTNKMLVLGFQCHCIKAFFLSQGCHNNKQNTVILLSNDSDKYVRNAKVWGTESKIRTSLPTFIFYHGLILQILSYSMGK